MKMIKNVSVVFGVLSMATSALALDFPVWTINNISDWDSATMGYLYPPSIIHGTFHEKLGETDGYSYPFVFQGSFGPEQPGTYGLEIDGSGLTNYFTFDGTNGVYLIVSGTTNNYPGMSVTFSNLVVPPFNGYYVNKISHRPFGHTFSLLCVGDNGAQTNSFSGSVFNRAYTGFPLPAAQEWYVRDNGVVISSLAASHFIDHGSNNITVLVQGDYNTVGTPTNNLHFTFTEF
jgi:hypothetical protein